MQMEWQAFRPYSGPTVIKVMLNSAEHKILPANKQKLLISTVVLLLNLAEFEILYAYKYENANISWHFHTLYLSAEMISCSAEFSAK